MWGPFWESFTSKVTIHTFSQQFNNVGKFNQIKNMYNSTSQQLKVLYVENKRH